MLFGSPLILVALGMTLVIATGGIDLSVGAVVAIAGALACLYISEQADQDALAGVFLAMAHRPGAVAGLRPVERLPGGPDGHPAHHRDPDPHGGRAEAWPS